MIDAFVEGVRSIVQVCHLVILAPVALSIVAAHGRWQAVVGAVAGVVLGGWIFAAGWLTLSDAMLRLSAVVLIAGVVVLGAPRACSDARRSSARPSESAPSPVASVCSSPSGGGRAWVKNSARSSPTHPTSRGRSCFPTIGFMLGISLPLDRHRTGVRRVAAGAGDGGAARLGRLPG